MPASDDPKPRRPGELPPSGELESVGMDELLRMYDEKMAEFAEGDIIRGRVLKVTSTEAIVDIGFKSEGIVPISELTSYAGELTVKPGDEIDVFVERLETSTTRPEHGGDHPPPRGTSHEDLQPQRA